MTIRDCNTCRYRDVDPKDDPCFSCQSVDAHRYRSWQPVVVHPVLGPYLIKSPSLEVYRSMGITTLDGQDRSVSYLPMEDAYIIQGKRYAAGIFEALLRVGEKFEVVEGINDTVCLKMLHTCSPQKPDSGLASLIESLIGEYWDIAHEEGKTGISQGDLANQVLGRIRSALILWAHRAAPEPEPVVYWDGDRSVIPADDVSYIPNWTDYYPTPLYRHPAPQSQPAVLAEWQKKQLVDDAMKEWYAGTTRDNMLVLVDKVLDAIGRRDNAA